VGANAVLLPNRYDPNRAHLIAYNWDKTQTLEAEAGGFLREGETAALFDPVDPLGDPVATTVCRSGRVRMPMPGEFAAFLVRADRH
jgi:hypothetical protein